MKDSNLPDEGASTRYGLRIFREGEEPNYILAENAIVKRSIVSLAAPGNVRDRPLEERINRAARSVLIYLQNATQFDLMRTQSRLDGGTDVRWVQAPVSRLLSGQQAVWASESYEAGRVIEGKVAYHLNGDNISNISVSIDWVNDPDLGLPEYKAKLVYLSLEKTIPIKVRLEEILRSKNPKHSWIIYKLH